MLLARFMIRSILWRYGWRSVLEWKQSSPPCGDASQTVCKIGNAMRFYGQMTPACLAVSILSVSALAQTGKPNPGYKLEMKPGPRSPGATAYTQKEPGDAVAVRADDAIVATSRSRSYKFLPTNRMQPVVASTYAPFGDRLRYEYTISNGLGAVNTIASFELVTAVPADVTAPSPWRSVKVNRSINPCLGFLRVAKDDDSNGRLAPGVKLDAIHVTSDYGPGLILVTFHPEPPSLAPLAPSDGDFVNGASPWVQQQLLALDTVDRRQVQGLAIGPVAEMRTDSAARILAEVEGAIQRPQLAVLRDYMLESPLPADTAGLIGWMTRVHDRAKDGIARDFVEAMLWRLRHLR